MNNVFVNAKNHGQEPLDVLTALPLERVSRIHLADHRREQGVLLDDHSGPPKDEVLALYAEALARVGRSVPTILEWDHGLAGLDELLDAADRIREVACAAWRAVPAERAA